MKKTLLALAVAATLVPSLAMAEAGDIVVRLRATHISADESSKLGAQTDATYGSGTAVALYGNSNAELRVDSNTIPEIDFSYYITKNIATELILAVGTRHDVKTTADAAHHPDLGSVNLLPPTLTLQWHFNPDQTIDPYVGAGINYTIFGNRQNFPALSNSVQVEPSSVGFVGQIGMDYMLDKNWGLNVDVKYATMSTNVSSPAYGPSAGKLTLNPWMPAVGVTYKF